MSKHTYMRTPLTLMALVYLTGCTFATYRDHEGRELVVADLRLSGSAADIEVVRKDGTIIRISRDQGSPEGTIEAIGDAVQPLRIAP